ncbi:MAG: SpoIID/LytB domain-containing protein [Candidatus Omnitrophota bacterium]
MQEIGKALISRIIQFAFLFSVLCSLCSTGLAQLEQVVRVVVIQEASTLNLKIKGSYEIIDPASKKVLSRGSSLKTTVTTNKDKIFLAGEAFYADKILLKTHSIDQASINGRVFRGDIELVKRGLALTAINHIGLEDYIKGISVREISHYWPSEALKVGVIAFRSFALYKMQENKFKDFDLTSDTYSQLYSGIAAERYRINRAVDETKGLVLTYQGKILPAFYHATCAGHTEDASLIWNIDIPPLKGVACDFCKYSPHFSWHYVLALDEMQAQLAKVGYKPGKIESIGIAGLDASGRIIDLNIISSREPWKISAKDFRNCLGANFIRSTNFTVSIDGSDAVFEGFGWGHGVGLCQWGAYFMAKSGKTFREILRFYYPEAEITLIDKS